MKKKLTLSKIKIKSFSTQLTNDESSLIKGGGESNPTYCEPCPQTPHTTDPCDRPEGTNDPSIAGCQY